jgi:polysaccharide biosynthesis/export protein
MGLSHSAGHVVAALVCAHCMLAVPPTRLEAQQPTPDQLRLLEQLRQQADSPTGEGEAWRAQVLQAPTGLASAPLLERQINRTEYHLGPGDVVTVSIFGYQNALFSLPVTPEGRVIVPGVRVVPVGGLNIEQAEQRVRQQVRRVYPDAEVGLSLTAVRSFTIFLVGDVPEPGVWPATAVTRVSQVIPTANADGVIYRNVLLRRPDGQERGVDLARFVRTGDLTFNPTLGQGDIVQVPPVNRTVTISGRVAYPGTYDFRPSEPLAELLLLANGGIPFPYDAADSLVLTRFTGNPAVRVENIAVSDAVGAVGRTLLVEPFDGIFVPRVAHHMKHTTATIDGEVRWPGTYPIRPDVTSVQDLIEMAGGLSTEAAGSRAVLRREPIAVSDRAARPLDSVRSPLEEVSLAQLTREERRSLQVTSRVDERDVIINLTTEGPAENLSLMDGDLIFVPRRRNDVVVLGAAANPGIMAYEPGQAIDYFVQQAGGYSPRADIREVVVQREGLGVRLHRNDLSIIEPGDRIIIPFKERKTTLDHVQTAQLIVGTISGFVLTYFAFERIWR